MSIIDQNWLFVEKKKVSKVDQLIAQKRIASQDWLADREIEEWFEHEFILFFWSSLMGLAGRTGC